MRLSCSPPAPGTGLQPSAGGPTGSAWPWLQQASQLTLTARVYVPGAVKVTPQSICWPTPTFAIWSGEYRDPSLKPVWPLGNATVPLTVLHRGSLNTVALEEADPGSTPMLNPFTHA